MSKYLASIQSLAEARQLSSCLPDILDMKNPAQGALGAMPVQEVAQVVDWLAGRCLSSATIGDLPMQADLISDKLRAMSASGVDYLKIGLFNETGLSDCIAALTPTLARLPQPVIAVLFADQPPAPDIVPVLANSGFAGVMMDTASKNGQTLLDFCPLPQLQAFVSQARQLNMLSGLAGALRFEDVPLLLPLQADYLGFRSALCADRQRTALLQPQRLQQLRDMLLAQVA